MITYNLFAVIVNWNLADQTITCVDSLLAAGLPLEKIILVDNGSDDHSIEKFTLKYGGDLGIISNTHNKGFAVGVNQGIIDALEKKAEWVFLINNDAYVARDFFIKVRQFLSDEYEIISPIIYYHDQPDKIWFIGDRLVPGTLFTYGLWKNKIDHGNLPSVIEIDFANGAGMIVKDKVFETIGLFDEKLFMYGEEVDFCWRARLRNFKFISATDVKMWHIISASASKNSSQKNYLKARNLVIFYKRYTQGIKRIYMLSASLVIILIKSLAYLFLFNLKLMSSLIQGWYDGFKYNEEFL